MKEILGLLGFFFLIGLLAQQHTTRTKWILGVGIAVLLLYMALTK
ncbi:hypothetical protein KSD_37350 [Ktedonobacter sp. SOSP1-85]|jgi:hypothetical protein|uniref:Uncharacterized protein n=1 Tax=Ktedonobacter robiniae TaxID=2778365 RepID=A0ABQ3UID0_9CHLR|nr:MULTISPECIES: hypothetical protein [Ktedonobacter]GHO52459.1 hypothetical protein KSB_09340 [Ktedonobacter robiniae]GHO75964.1 hypothetical protein KSD_37350 [Ktedonobacter sp. SOSP1-85]